MHPETVDRWRRIDKSDIPKPEGKEGVAFKLVKGWLGDRYEAESNKVKMLYDRLFPGYNMDKIPQVFFLILISVISVQD